MNVSADDVLLILGKWQEERRIIQAGLYCSSQPSSCIVGRIEEISPEGQVRITAGSLIKSTGGLIGMQINLHFTRTAAFHDGQGEPLETHKLVRLRLLRQKFFKSGLPVTKPPRAIYCPTP
jgi:hypothetical protein